MKKHLLCDTGGIATITKNYLADVKFYDPYQMIQSTMNAEVILISTANINLGGLQSVK